MQIDIERWNRLYKVDNFTQYQSLRGYYRIKQEPLRKCERESAENKFFYYIQPKSMRNYDQQSLIPTRNSIKLRKQFK